MTEVATVPGNGQASARTPDVADQWLGTGLRFPIRPDAVTGALPRVSGMDRIRQSIEQILDTEPGERIMLPEFGCGLRRYLMEPNTLTTRTAIAEDIEQRAAALGAADPAHRGRGDPGRGARRWSGSRSPTSGCPTCARTTSSTRSTSGG